MVDFKFKITRKLGLTDFFEPDSETLTSDTRYPVGWGDSIQKRPGPWGVAPLPQNYV